MDIPRRLILDALAEAAPEPDALTGQFAVDLHALAAAPGRCRRPVPARRHPPPDGRLRPWHRTREPNPARGLGTPIRRARRALRAFWRATLRPAMWSCSSSSSSEASCCGGCYAADPCRCQGGHDARRCRVGEAVRLTPRFGDRAAFLLRLPEAQAKPPATTADDTVWRENTSSSICDLSGLAPRPSRRQPAADAAQYVARCSR